MFLRRWIESERQVLGTLLGLALALRTVTALTAQTIARDGSSFVDRALWLIQGDPNAALEVWPQMPLFYPTLIALLGSILGNLTAAGAAISVAAGTATIVPLYLLARDIWNRNVAGLACLIYAFLPSVVSLDSDVMSEGLFLFLFMSSAALTWFTLKTPSWSLALLNGVCAALAYETRVEGIYLVGAGLGWGALRLLARRGERAFVGHAFPGMVLFILLFLAVAGPYLLWVRAKLGHWGVSVNPFALMVLGQKQVFEYPLAWDRPWEPAAASPTPSGPAVLRAARTFLDGASRDTFYVLLPALAIGWVRWRRGASDPIGPLYLTLLAVGYWTPTFVPFFLSGVWSPRYILPGFVFTMPFIAAGLLWLFGFIPERRRLAASASLLGILCAIMTVKSARPHRYDTAGIVEAGVALREAFGAGKVHLVVCDRRISHYGEGHGFIVPPTLERIEKSVASVHPVSIVLYSDNLTSGEPGIEQKVAGKYPLVKRIVRGNDWIAIYAVR